MNELKRRNQILILLTSLCLLLTIWLLTSGKYRSVPWANFLFLFSVAGVLVGSAGIWITANKIVRAGLILDNQIIDAGAIISCFGILWNAKVIPFNQGGIRLKTIEISNTNMFITYGSDKKTDQIELAYEWKEMEEIQSVAEKFRYETGISAQIKESQGNTGYSWKIRDPAFRKYLKHSNCWSLLFASILALAAVVGFFIYGETSSEMDNPQALMIGMAIGAMFLLIAGFQVVGRKMSRTWDGVVSDKYVAPKKRKRDGYREHLEYTVAVKSQTGKIVTLTAEDDDTCFHYYQIGDRVRHHKGLNSFEKYDKSQDTIIFCSACASLNEIQAESCFRCGCPLLK